MSAVVYFFVRLPSPETNSEFACYKDESQEENKSYGISLEPKLIQSWRITG